MLNLDVAQFTTVWAESFDNSADSLNCRWRDVGTSIAGQVTLTSYASAGYTVDSGAMVPPTGANAGNVFYSVT